MAKSNRKNVPKKGAPKGSKQFSNTDLPRKTVEDCLKVAKPIYDTYGDSDASLDELAASINMSTLNVKFKYLVWSAQAYGIIVRNGDKYRLSETGRKIFMPESEVQRKESLIKAIMIPTVLSRFYSDYNGKILPEGEFFDNVLTSRYSIPRERVNEAKDIIVANAKYTGIIWEFENGKSSIRLEGTLSRSQGDEHVEAAGLPEVVIDKKNLSKSDNICFYITPIGEEGTDVRRHADMFLKHLIEPAFDKFGYKVVRADKIEKSGLITQQIFEALVSSKICVADMSYGNPNAFYELAIRHMIKKPTIQIIRKGDKIPFDVSQGRTIVVDVSDVFTVMDKMLSAQNELVEHIKAIVDSKSGSQSEDNPVSIYLPGLSIKI